MSDIIRLLPDSVANQIAAGEVIQRPASVIKELVENAVDAGATSINVVVTDAGKTCIQVIDNGKGMSTTDARMAFERHATSKIREAADLFSLHTMGFRGEALASIAAVSQVELRTRLADEEVGTSITVEGSVVKSQEPVSCPVGSNFIVKNLFYNVPARRKFLKSDSTELNNILSEMERIMLVNPGISFTFVHNDTNLYSYTSSSLKKRIIDIYGRKLNQQLLPISVETHLVKISGFISTPESSKKKAQQFFFVNNRYMRHPYFHKSVMEAYSKLIPVGEQITYFIYFDVNPADIDVNIHPTKTEIKFENEQSIWQILMSAVREGLARSASLPSIDFDTEGMPDIPVMPSTRNIAPPTVSINKNYNPFESSPKVDRNWRDLYDGLTAKNDKFSGSSWDDDLSVAVGGGVIIDSRSNDENEDFDSNDKYVAPENSSGVQANIIESNDSCGTMNYFQYKAKYIIMSVGSGMMIVDQHRAHVKVLFDRFRKMVEGRNGNSQGLLFPELIRFSASESVVLDSIMGELEILGFDLSNLGGGSYSINSVPVELKGADYAEVICDMIKVASETARDVKDDIRSSLALSLAKASAIPYGQVLSQKEMDELMASLLSSQLPDFTPDGKKILTIMKDDEFSKLFQ